MTSTDSSRASISAPDVAFYRREGYVILRNALSAEEISDLQGAYDECLERARGLTESDAVLELEDGRDERMLRGAATRDARLDGSSVRIPLPLQQALGLFDTQSRLSESHYARRLTG